MDKWKQNLSKKELEKIYFNSHVLKYQKKEVILRQHTPAAFCILIEQGLVKIHKQGRNGKSLLLQLAQPGQLLGLISLLGANTYHYSVTALIETKVRIIDWQIVRAILKTNAPFSYFVLQEISLRELFLQDKFMNYYQKQLPGRLADILLYLANDIFYSSEFILPLTRNEMAEMAGATKESLIRILSEFKNDKIIELNGKKLCIKSMNLLRKLSQFG